MFHDSVTVSIFFYLFIFKNSSVLVISQSEWLILAEMSRKTFDIMSTKCVWFWGGRLQPCSPPHPWVRPY